MRTINVNLLHKALQEENIPIAGCALPIYDLNIGSPQYRVSYFPYGDKYARIDWKSEPTIKQKIKVAEILAYHAKIDVISVDNIIDKGSGFPEVSKIKSELSIRTTPKSNQFESNKVIDILQWAYSQGTRLSDFSEVPFWDSFVKAPEEVMYRVEQTLRNQGALEFFDNGVIFFGNQTHRVQILDLTHWLLARGIKYSPEEAVGRLRQFIEIDAIPAERIVWIRGVNVNNIVDLGEGIRLIPFFELPDSPIKKNIENLNQDSYFRSTVQATPTAALVQSVSIKPKMASDFPEDPTTYHDKKSSKILSNVLQCLTLVGPCAPIGLCEYYQLPEWIPLSNIGYSASSFFHEIDPKISTAPDKGFPTFDALEARKVIQDYLQINEELRQKLRLPIERLNRAIRRIDVVDKAIELRIALESLLSADRDKDAPISFLIRVRGSLLLGGSADQRRKSKVFLRELYDLCSQATHNGKLDNINRTLRLPTLYVIQDGIDLCVNLIKIILEKGCIPNLDDMILGINSDK